MTSNHTRSYWTLTTIPSICVFYQKKKIYLFTNLYCVLSVYVRVYVHTHTCMEAIWYTLHVFMYSISIIILLPISLSLTPFTTPLLTIQSSHLRVKLMLYLLSLQFVVTIFTCFLVDKIGRRKSLFLSLSVMIPFLSGMAIYLGLTDADAEKWVFKYLIRTLTSISFYNIIIVLVTRTNARISS